MADVLSKQDVQDVLEVIKQLYLEDRIPWICGYSGGKDSTAIVQLVWMALRQIPKEKRVKTVHVISSKDDFRFILINIFVLCIQNFLSSTFTVNYGG